MFNRGFDKFRREIEITQLIKTIRILKTVAKKNFSQIQWRIYKLQKGYRKLHPIENFDKLTETKVFKKQPFSGKANLKSAESCSPTDDKSNYDSS